MNCVFNGLLDKNKIYDQNFVPTWPDDLGVSIGATYLENNNLNKRNSKDVQVYLGPSYGNKEILSLLNKYKLKFKNQKKYLAMLQRKFLMVF